MYAGEFMCLYPHHFKIVFLQSHWNQVERSGQELQLQPASWRLMRGSFNQQEVLKCRLSRYFVNSVLWGAGE
jgi:hypothetical protein